VVTIFTTTTIKTTCTVIREINFKRSHLRITFVPRVGTVGTAQKVLR
jgi:hypothetical protein